MLMYFLLVKQTELDRRQSSGHMMVFKDGMVSVYIM